MKNKIEGSSSSQDLSTDSSSHFSSLRINFFMVSEHLHPEEIILMLNKVERSTPDQS